MKLQTFLTKHNACKEGADWALATGCETIEDLWLRDDMRGDWRIWIARRTLPTKALQLFACRAARTVWHILKDERSKNVVIVAESYLAGAATIEDLKTARDAAANAAYAAANAAAYAAYAYAAYTVDAAANAAYAAANAAAYTVDANAAYAAANAAAYAVDAAAYAAANAAAYAAYAVDADANAAAYTVDAAANAAAYTVDADANAARKSKWDELSVILRELAPTICVEEAQP